VSQSQEYLDFDLFFQRDGTSFQTRVLRAPGGEARGRFELPFGPIELENFLLKLGQPRRSVRRADTPQTQLTKQFGGQLFQALFTGEVLTSFQRSVEESARQNRGLRVRLRMNDTPELADLPWEYLYNVPRDEFMALGWDTPIVRYLELPRPTPSLVVKPPLRILVAVASPNGVVELDSTEEWKRLNGALLPVLKTGRVVLERLEVATLESLQARLQGSEIHVFHFIGHGGFNSNTQDGFLLFEDEQRNSRHVSGEDLGVLLRNHPSIRLAVINACDGARSAQDDPFAGVAQSLIRQGLPAVIAMQFEISDEAAIAFATGFYAALANGYPVDAALVETRTGIYVKRLGAEWGTPVLFMRAPDGRLFDIEAQDLPVARGISLPSRSPRRFPSLELCTVLTGGSLLAGALAFLFYKSSAQSVSPLASLQEATRDWVGISSLILALLGAFGYGYWKTRQWREDWRRNSAARIVVLSAVLLGSIAYSGRVFLYGLSHLSPEFTSIFNFNQSPINLSLTPQLTQMNYGFSSLEVDKTVRGEGVRIKTIRVELTVHVNANLACCDVWVLFGPRPFGFQGGPVVNGQWPGYIDPNPDVAPVQARFVIGNRGAKIQKDSDVHYYATYNFDTGRPSGDVDNFKGGYAPPLTLSDGLYAQVFLWNGNPGVNVNVDKISVTVEGLKPGAQK
jgi:hypothetical protein